MIGLLNIVDAIIDVLLTPVQWVLDAIPTVTWPAWFQTSGSDSIVAKMAEWGVHIHALDSWFPVSEFFAAMAIAVTVSAACLAVFLVRLIASYLTGGGGAT